MSDLPTNNPPVRQGATVRFDLDASLNTHDCLRQMTARYNLLRQSVQPMLTFYNGQPYQVRWNPNAIAPMPMGLLNDLYYGVMDAGSLRLEHITPTMLKPRWVQ